MPAEKIPQVGDAVYWEEWAHYKTVAPKKLLRRGVVAVDHHTGNPVIFMTSRHIRNMEDHGNVKSQDKDKKPSWIKVRISRQLPTDVFDEYLKIHSDANRTTNAKLRSERTRHLYQLWMGQVEARKSRRSSWRKAIRRKN